MSIRTVEADLNVSEHRDAVLAMVVEDAGEDEVIVNPHRLRGSSTPRLVDDQEVPDPLRRFEPFLVALGRAAV